jgi:hypothetical protein
MQLEVVVIQQTLNVFFTDTDLLCPFNVFA